VAAQQHAFCRRADVPHRRARRRRRGRVSIKEVDASMGQRTRRVERRREALASGVPLLASRREPPRGIRSYRSTCLAGLGSDRVTVSGRRTVGCRSTISTWLPSGNTWRRSAPASYVPDDRGRRNARYSTTCVAAPRATCVGRSLRPTVICCLPAISDVAWLPCRLSERRAAGVRNDDSRKRRPKLGLRGGRVPPVVPSPTIRPSPAVGRRRGFGG